MPSPALSARNLALVLPALGLVAMAIMILLYRYNYAWYLHVFFGLGFVPIRFPFYDWDGTASAIACWNKGFNVYVVNPCVTFDRTHNYSPLWLRAAFVSDSAASRNMIGTGLAAGFYASLFAIFKPENWRDVALGALAAFSAMTVYALERANVDAMIFLVMAMACLLGTRGLYGRLMSYAAILFAAFLKYYPLVALLTMLRERSGLFAVLAALSAAIVALAVLANQGEMAAGFALIPHGTFNSVFFGATNLPAGLAYLIRNHSFPAYEAPLAAPTSAGLQMLFFAAFVLAGLAQALVLARHAGMAQAFRRTGDREKLFLVAGALTVTGCFFAAANIGYRGIFLVLVVAGLIAMRRQADAGARAALGFLLAATLFLMWNECIFHWLSKAATPSILILFWLARELLWWQAASMLIAIILIFVSQSRTIIEAKSLLAGQKPADASRNS